jgi:hypothetical protein
VPTFADIEGVTWSAQRIPAAVNLSLRTTSHGVYFLVLVTKYNYQNLLNKNLLSLFCLQVYGKIVATANEVQLIYIGVLNQGYR